MKRKDFLKNVTAGTLGTATIGFAAAGCAREEALLQEDRNWRTEIDEDSPRMVVGCQSRRGTSRENLEFLARHGVYHTDSRAPTSEGQQVPEEWSLDHALRQVEEADHYGISIDAYHLSGGSSHFGIWSNIMLGRSPERDREIEQMQNQIEIASKAGVHLLLYNATILPVLRTGRTVDPNRANSSYSTWNYEEAVAQGMHEEPHEAGEVGMDELYERITYWLDRIIPVAEEFKVKMGCHIADPPTPEGYRGIARWNSPDVFEGIKRFANLYNSPAHGFNFCIGSTAEGLEDPRNQIYPIIEWLGERNQIFNVHYRNIKGGWNNFQEVYPDNGDMNFVHVLKALKDVGYAGMVMPDHIPEHEDPASRDQGFTFAYGYTKALLQSLYGFDAYPDRALDLTAPGYTLHFG